MDEDTLSPPCVRRHAGRPLVRHAVLDGELVTEHFLPRTRQSDAPPLPTHTERTRRRVRAAGRTASFFLKSHMSTTTRPRYGATLKIMFHGSHESTTQCASRCAGKRGTSSSSSPWNFLAHSARFGSSARACAPARESDEPVGSEINSPKCHARARESPRGHRTHDPKLSPVCDPSWEAFSIISQAHRGHFHDSNTYLTLLGTELLTWLHSF